MDLLTLFPFIMIGIAALGGALLVYEKYFRKTETAQEVVDRLKAKGVGGPNDTGRTNYDCKYCGGSCPSEFDDEPQDEDLLDPALVVLGIEAAEAIAQAGPEWSGDGGEFSGAGASGSYDEAPSTDSSNDSFDSSDSSSSDSSSDSGSSDSGSDS